MIARLVPTKFYRIREYTSVSNESNAFTNTDSDTYATVVNESAYSNRVFVGGFDFSQIPANATVTSYSVKFKISADSGNVTGNFNALYNGTSAISGQERMDYELRTTPEISSGDNLTQWADLLAAGDDFNISIPGRTQGTTYIYGVEIEVTYDLHCNKVVYGTTVLVDLTADTVTAATLMQGYTAHDKSGALITGTYVPPTFATQSKTVTPTESAQTITPDSGYDGLSSVSVGAISSTYVGSGIDQRDSTDLTASGATVTVPAGYYAEQASKAVASGSAGTPTATKGTVSNHAVSVTPSVTNTTGYITGSTKTGTAVSVSASELVSGSQTITDNGTVNVTNLASVTVAIPIVTYHTSSSAPTSSQGSDGDLWLVTA